MLAVNLGRFPCGHRVCACGSILSILLRNIRSRRNVTSATLTIGYHCKVFPEHHGIALLLRPIIQVHRPSKVAPRRIKHFQPFSSCDSSAGLSPQLWLHYSIPSAVTSYLNLLAFSLMLFHPSALGLLESKPPLRELPPVMELISWHRSPLPMS